MLGLPRESHRYFIEPVSGSTHIMFHLYKRFVNFVWCLKKSKKLPLRVLCDEIIHNARSTTGSNIRHLMLRYNGGTFDELRESIRKSPPTRRLKTLTYGKLKPSKILPKRFTTDQCCQVLKQKRSNKYGITCQQFEQTC